MPVIIEGGDETFRAVAYTPPSPSLTGFLSQQLDQFSAQIHQGAQHYVDLARQTFDSFNSSEAMRLAKAVRRKVDSLWTREGIFAMTDIAQIQNANLTMQRWIMAEPTIRNMYHQQRCEGFADSYVDMHPGDVGESHYDYRRVMDGLVVEQEDELVSVQYFDEVHDGDELDIDEQVAILRTWDSIKNAIHENKEDPTSPFNASL